MSEYTTIYITHTKARSLAINFVLSASDEQLERVVDEVIRDRLYNCRIVSDGAYGNEDHLVP